MPRQVGGSQRSVASPANQNNEASLAAQRGEDLAAHGETEEHKDAEITSKIAVGTPLRSLMGPKKTSCESTFEKVYKKTWKVARSSWQCP